MKKLENKNETNIKSHNGIISFWKFAFAIMIVLYHSKALKVSGETSFFSRGGYISVEFFFLVSGYLLFKTALNKKDEGSFDNLGKETFQFLLKKIKTFLPYTILAGILTLITLKIYNNTNIYQNISSIWNILLLRMSGLRGSTINAPVWYISSMLLCMTIIYPLIRKYKYNFVYIAVPVIVFLGFGYLNYNYGSIKSPVTWLGIIYKGNLRAFIELSLGGLLYIACEKIKKINFTKLGKLLLTIIELTGFIIPFVVAHFIKKASNYDFIMIGIISISIILAFSEKTLEYKLFNNKLFYWLEKLSLSIYMFHSLIKIFMTNSPYFTEMNYYSKVSIFLSITIILSITFMYFLDYLKKKNYYFDKIKKILIIEN